MHTSVLVLPLLAAAFNYRKNKMKWMFNTKVTGNSHAAFGYVVMAAAFAAAFTGAELF